MSKPIDDHAFALAKAANDAAFKLERYLCDLWEGYDAHFDAADSTYVAYSAAQKVRMDLDDILNKLPRVCSECGALKGAK